MVSSHFRFDVFFQLWERRPYARLNLFPEDSTRSRTNIWTRYCNAFPTSSWHRVNLRWRKDVLSSNEPNSTRYAFQRKVARIDRWKKYSNDENWSIRVDNLRYRVEIYEIYQFQRGTFPRLENIFHSIDIRIHSDKYNTRYRDAYVINAKQEARKLRREQG